MPAAHEAWHSLEHRLSPAEIDNIDAQLQEGVIDLSDHGYYDTMVERRARAFETWCMRLVQRLSGRFVRSRDGSRIDEVFARAWTGETGAILDGPSELERVAA